MNNGGIELRYSYESTVQISKKSLRYLSEMFERSLNRNVENLDLIYEDEAMEG